MMKYVDIVLWPSVYSGGRTLSALSSLYHFNIVTATKSGSVDGWDNTPEGLLFMINNYGKQLEDDSEFYKASKSYSQIFRRNIIILTPSM